MYIKSVYWCIANVKLQIIDKWINQECRPLAEEKKIRLRNEFPRGLKRGLSESRGFPNYNKGPFHCSGFAKIYDISPFFYFRCIAHGHFYAGKTTPVCIQKLVVYFCSKISVHYASYNTHICLVCCVSVCDVFHGITVKRCFYPLIAANDIAPLSLRYIFLGLGSVRRSSAVVSSIPNTINWRNTCGGIWLLPKRVSPYRRRPLPSAPRTVGPSRPCSRALWKILRTAREMMWNPHHRKRSIGEFRRRNRSNIR